MLRRNTSTTLRGITRSLTAATVLTISFGVGGPLVSASDIPSVVVHVKGNHLVNATGATIQLRGVDLSGSEFSCSGDSGVDGWSVLDTPTGYSVSQQINEMSAWGINAVRVPLNEDCWLGINGISSAYSGANYRTGISDLVNAINNAGMIAILDLHYNAPGAQVSDSTSGLGGTGQQVVADADHAPAFWQSVATAFKSNPGLIFDLYNEPYDIPWSCWKNGGCDAPVVDGTAGGWPIAGMQSLIDDVRAEGADQPIMLGGLNYANDLSQWLTYEPSDTLGTPQLIASVHVYAGESCDDVSCWSSQIAPVAAEVPVVTGEFGPSTCDGNFVDTYMNWADSTGVSYLAWTWGSVADGWSCANSPALLASDDGTPDAYGAAIESHYQALATAPPSSTTTSTTHVGTVPIIGISQTSYAVKNGVVVVPVSCREVTCATTVVVILRSQTKEIIDHHAKTIARTVVIGSGFASVPAGGSELIAVHLTTVGVGDLARTPNHRVSVTMSASAPNAITNSLRVTLLG